ncbi:TrbC family F-type conjugative pilus assembly protein [Rhodovastum atsumiense]|uniref:Conjugal transfer protein TraW n=1 Tax=Rhodovastum atsumiense TaxID=504468 RepID=A0A5M6IJR7_9PROT|nr:TrbC family F-type conjugative pilus assembly protein [Rhodovastum atsumiense]KAA5608514.1 hypothetical protein F1189_28680 [Rhodovastum atsumiense]
MCALLIALVLAWPLAGLADDGFAFLRGRPVDAATQALIEDLTRKAEQVTGRGREDGQAMLDRAQAAAAALRAAPPSTGIPEVLDRASAATRTTPQARSAETPAPVDAGTPAPPQERELVLFVSWSMGEAALADTLREAMADGHTRVVVRGVLPGERIGDAVRRLAPLLRQRVQGASIDVDPPAFRQAGVSEVPTIWDPVTGAQWRGSVALAAFRRHLAEARAPVSEAMGPAVQVTEVDLGELMRAQAARLDVAGLQEQAYRRFWERAALVTLPAAARSAERLVDPTVWLSAPVHDARGQVIAAAGTRINTLETHPWRRRLIVFDVTDPAQFAWALRRTQDGRPTLFLTTQVDRAASWDGWQASVKALGQPLYLLQAQLAQRLDLRVVPSVIEQAGALLRVREIGPAELRLQ